MKEMDKFVHSWYYLEQYIGRVAKVKRIVLFFLALVVLWGGMPQHVAMAETAATEMQFPALGYVNTSKLKLRNKPNAKAKVIATCKQNQEITILEVDGDWYKVQVNNKKGYIAKEYVVVGEAPLPIETPTPTQEPIAQTIYITRTGKKYHHDENCNGGTYFKSTLNEALKRGLKPCNKCVN